MTSLPRTYMSPARHGRLIAWAETLAVAQPTPKAPESAYACLHHL